MRGTSSTVPGRMLSMGKLSYGKPAELGMVFRGTESLLIPESEADPCAARPGRRAESSRVRGLERTWAADFPRRGDHLVSLQQGRQLSLLLLTHTSHFYRGDTMYPSNTMIRRRLTGVQANR